jgi:AcrR family transcriptional regulator
MPKPTFHNLPKDKQARIVNAAIDEFSSVPFDAASVNRIVRGAKIAKGSFYQYFENMVDLYEYAVITIGTQRKTALIQTSGFEQKKGLFGQLKQVMTVSLRFGMTEPKLFAAGMSLLGASFSNNALRPIYEQRHRLSLQFFEAILKAGVQSGAVRNDIDVLATATLITTTLTHALEPMIQHLLGFNIQDIIREPVLVKDVEEGDIEKVVDALLNVIFQGIQADPDAGKLDMNAMLKFWKDT